MATEWSSVFDFKDSTIVLARDLTKTYVGVGRTITAVRRASFAVMPGTLTVIVGPSGSGKTTLLHILAGLVRPDSGKVLFHGLDVSGAEDDVLRILREEFISIAYQEHSMVRYMTVEENVELPLSMMDIAPEDCRKASGPALDMVGLRERKAHTAEEISGGERQLANMARALAKNPILVLADEPTANLDQGKIEQLMKIMLEEIREKGTTFIVATHDPLLTRHADMVLEMRDGEIQMKGNTLGRAFLLPMRDLPAELFRQLRDEIGNELRGMQVTVGQVVEALGTPFQVTGIEGREQGSDRGIVDGGTRIELGRAADGKARPGAEGMTPGGPGESVADRVAGSMKRKRRPNLQYSILKYLTIPTSVLFAGLALAIWIQLGVWTAYSTAFLAVAALFLALVALLAPSEETSLRPARGSTKLTGAFPGISGIQWSASKRSLCDFCGAGWAAEVCHMCGRKMCERCWPMVSREPTFCRDHLRCIICGREEAGGMHYTAGCVSCLICGNYICQECFVDGMCLECATDSRSRRTSSEDGTEQLEGLPQTQPLRTLILEPEGDVSNEICNVLGPSLRQSLQEKRVKVGQALKHTGLAVRVEATMPLGGGTVGGNTQVNLVNREERDEELRRLRKRSDFFVCYYPGCDYVIARFCCVCLRPACPNHSTRCKTCGCPVCEDHLVEGECTRCIPRPVAEGRVASLRELLGPLKAPVGAIISAYVMLSIMLYGEPLRRIDPNLPLIIFLLYFAVPSLALVLTSWRRRRSEARGARTPVGKSP